MMNFIYNMGYGFGYAIGTIIGTIIAPFIKLARTVKKLKTVRYFGSFYECDGKLGWMPFWKVIIAKKLTAPDEVHWVKQSEVKFVEGA